MASYYVSSAGTGVAPYTSFATGAQNLMQLCNYITGSGGPGWVVGDVVYVLNTHSYTHSTTASFAFPDTFMVPILCVDSSLNPQPTAGNTSFATEATGASLYGIDMYGMAYIYGMRFITGNGSTSTTSIRIGKSTVVDCAMKFENCDFRVGNTSPVKYSQVGVGLATSGNNAQFYDFLNCGFGFSNINQLVSLDYGIINLTGCKISGGVAPNTVFELGSGTVTIDGGSYSFNTALVSLANDDPGYLRGKNLYLSSGTVTTGTIASNTAMGGPIVDVTGYASTANTYTDYFENIQGKVFAQTSKYLTSSTGQSNGDGSNVKPALQMTSASSATQVNKFTPLYTKWIPKRVLSTGAKTVSIKVAYDRSTALNNNDLWMEVASMSGAAVDTSPDISIEYTHPIITSAIRVSDSAAISIRDFNYSTPTPLADSAEAWTGTFTNKKTYTFSKSITLDQQGFIFVRIGLSAPGITVFVAPDVTVS